MSTIDPTFKKFDQGDEKRRWHLLPVEATEEILKVLEYGAQKYDADNWRKGTEWHRYYDALMRHMFAWWKGESNDPETGLSHLAHAGCCLLFLLNFEVTKAGADDRWATRQKAQSDPLTFERNVQMDPSPKITVRELLK